uniref:Checkpoint protein n=1 Tax=Lynceus sp. MCZ IZ 141354 TaxID=1930659 RepID=A0A9N6WRU8_9CRUS|nr:EOG090X0TJE [Lynceus sp. MCZ IZ 141354]
MFFIIRDQQSHSSSPVIWCEIEPNNFFESYSMDGLSATENEIYLEFVSNTVAKVVGSMKTAVSAKFIKIKLTKKVNQPCLTIDINLPTLSNARRSVTHDIPVTVIPNRLWSDYKEPDIPAWDIITSVPPIRQLTTIIDRMKKLVTVAQIIVNVEGEITISANNSLLTINSHFDRVDVIEHRDRRKQSSVYVDVKKLHQFLSGDLVTENIQCCIVDKKLMCLQIMNDFMTLRYFLPPANSDI